MNLDCWDPMYAYSALDGLQPVMVRFMIRVRV